jgi:hypothetical protein
MKSTATAPKHRGSALVVALILIGIVTAMGAATYIVLGNKYRVVHQAASWQESLLTAEAGVDMAMTEIRRQVYDSEPLWSKKNGWDSDGTRSTSKSVLLRKGEGGTESIAQVVVEWPEYLKDPSGEQWYRIVAHGYCQVPGGTVVAGAPEDAKLRKLSLMHDRRAEIDKKDGIDTHPYDKADGTAAHPYAHRVIEAIAKPQYVFRMALFAVKRIDLKDHNIVVDSYDSRDPKKSNWNESANQGTYPWNDPTNQKEGVNEEKRQWNGDIGTNGSDDGVINAGNAYIYGTANTNGGTVLNDANVTGNYLNDPNRIRTDFSMPVPGVLAPTGGTQTTIDSKEGLQATTGDGTRIVVPNISLSGQEELHIKGEPGKDTFIEIVVSGDVTVTGQALIKLDPGVHVRFFVEGDADIAGNGVTNPNSPLNLQIYGCDRAIDPSTGEITDPGTIKISGNGGFSGAVYAPTYNIELKGGGNSDTVYGAFGGYTVTMTGVQSVHYDEALGDGGLVNGYNIVSWFEDER